MVVHNLLQHVWVFDSSHQQRLPYSVGLRPFHRQVDLTNPQPSPELSNAGGGIEPLS
jgi:hypothetical protein